MAWSEKQIREYYKRQGRAVPAVVSSPKRPLCATEDRESASAYDRAVSQAYVAQEGVEFNKGEEAFITAWKQKARVPFPFERGVRVCSHRKMNFDFAIVDLKIAVEIDGGIHGTVIHEGQMLLNRSQMEADREKWNLANEYGWTLLNYTDRQVETEPDKVIAQVRRVIDIRIASVPDPE